MINKIIAGILPYMPRGLVWIFSKKYIAGKTLDDAVRVTKELNAQGIMVTIDLLGEFITRLEQAEENTGSYLKIIDRIRAEKLDANFSVKPTFFGLLLDEEACYRNIRQVVEKASGYDNFVRIDMEDSPCTDREIKLFRRLKAEFPKHVGLVLQAYMRRTLTDIINMADLHSTENPLNFRICKGIYVEQEIIAYKKYQEIVDHFLKTVDYMFARGMYPAIATHDKAVVEGAYALIRKYNVPREKYEFQMLYGVTPELRKSIAENGHRMRVYVPFGQDWFGYSSRRLKENPKMVTHILKALFVPG
jgi:proline dehydrogenase